MKLEKLVAPIDLCEQIPNGEFKDTYFSYSWCSFRNEYIICKTEWKHPKLSFPAPTLPEILEDLHFFKIAKQCSTPWIEVDDFYGEKENLVESALEVWLKYKGNKNA